MFASVLALMAALPGARFLMMSASLPEGRKKLLMKQFSETVQIPSPVELEILPRYRFKRAGSRDTLFSLVNEYVKKGKKVLWITNTVARAQNIYDQASNRGIHVLSYHSRFKYGDRVSRHRTVIAGFDPSEKKGILAVTTQVAEMSLDLDADLMISEFAPIPALIQRLGRLNRRITPKNQGTPREVWFVQPDSALPYGNDELDLANRWIDQLIKKDSPLSQQDLARVFNDLSPKMVDEADTKMEWLDSGWLAEPGPVRDGGYSVSVIFKEDLEQCKRDHRLLIKKTIPLNFNEKMGMDHWMAFKGHLIAPEGSIHYNKKKGASWPKP